MKKLTPKERGKIYLKVTKKCFKDSSTYACYELEKAGNLQDFRIKNYKDFNWLLKNYFPEFLLFKPDLHTPSWRIWFTNDLDRVLALLFAYEMTKDATE